MKITKIVSIVAGVIISLQCGRSHTIKYTDSKNNRVQIYSINAGAKISRKEIPAVVFIQINGCDKKLWERQTQTPELQKYRLITYDLRGHGKSTHFNDKQKYINQYSLKLHAEDLKHVLEYYDLDNALVVGWSLGGHIILRYLSDNPVGKIANAMIFGAVPSIGLAGIKDYPQMPPTDAMQFVTSKYLLSAEISVESIRRFVSLALEAEPDFHGSINLPEEDLKHWTKLIGSVDGYARVGLLDGSGVIAEDFSDGILDMSLEQMTSYNVWQLEMIPDIPDIPRIQTPVKLMISENDMFPMESIEYMSKLNPGYFQIVHTGRVGHAVHFTAPDIFEKELISILEDK